MAGFKGTNYNKKHDARLRLDFSFLVYFKPSFASIEVFLSLLRLYAEAPWLRTTCFLYNTNYIISINNLSEG